MINKQVGMGGLHGVFVAKCAPFISHLLFANDCYLIFRANEMECFIIKDIITEYVEASSQVKNYDKSSISFSGNVLEDLQLCIANILGGVCRGVGGAGIFVFRHWWGGTREKSWLL